MIPMWVEEDYEESTRMLASIPSPSPFRSHMDATTLNYHLNCVLRMNYLTCGCNIKHFR